MINDGSNFKIQSGKEGSYRSSKTHASDDPKRDFRKILAKEGREEQPGKEKKEISEDGKEVSSKDSYEEIADSLEVQEAVTKKKGVSLFDLASVSKAEDADEVVAEIAEEEEISPAEFSKELQDQSLSALFRGYGSKEKLLAFQQEVLQHSQTGNKTELPEGKKTTVPEAFLANEGRKDRPDLLQETALDLPPSKNMQHAGKQREGSTSKFALEAQDLSAITPQPLAPETPQIANVQGKQEAQPARMQLKEIIDQIIDKLYTINTSGRSDTLIQLKHPPLFAGASVVITTFSSAKGEFNIAFENLSQAAQQLIAMKENQEALKFALDQKGYTVHIITATTLTETSSPIKGESSKRERGEGEQEGSFSQEKGKREE